MKKFKKSGLIFAAILICVIFLNLCNLCFSQEIPQKISYQGKLLESGVPVTGTKSITFTIDTWSETHPSVQVTDGLYSVTLGETTPIPTSIFDNSSTTTLQITVAGSPLSPQTDIFSVPYAYKTEKAVNAENADAIGGNAVSTTSPTTDHVLKWNGSQWTPQTDELGGLTLPYAGTNSGSSNAFEITNTGTMHAFKITDNGDAAAIYIDNASGPGWGAIEIDNYAGVGIDINNKSASTKEALNVYHTGDDFHCAYFYLSNVSNPDDAVYARTTGTGYAGYFNGDLYAVSANAGIKAFKIDHPLDPENKYLFHSSVESSDMMNVYNGNIVLDNNGEAIVELPEWFNALNKDFRYQLTCIGGYAPVYVDEEISNNSFKISGGASGIKISWQVTGIRRDPLADKNRIQVEVEKPDKYKGHYLHYKAYNQPIEKSIEVVKDRHLREKLNNNNKK